MIKVLLLVILFFLLNESVGFYSCSNGIKEWPNKKLKEIRDDIDLFKNYTYCLFNDGYINQNYGSKITDFKTYIFQYFHHVDIHVRNIIINACARIISSLSTDDF